MIKKSSYFTLPESFYSNATIIPLEDEELLLFNHELADTLNLTKHPEHPAPIALAYAGHQYGRYVPQLGDGRAALLGEVHTNNIITDIQLKGSGPTKFSRGGDGYATISSVLREYIISEAMHALGVPTTRSLAAATGTDQIMRASLEPRGILTRTSASFIRIGSFEYFAARKDYASIKKLADYTLSRNYPKCKDHSNKYARLLEAICSKQAALIAKWMSIGFIHGVMNTDNTSICGETLDYGPCAFMDEYKADRVFSSIDKYSRYAYNMQPDIMLWNLTSFANCIAFLLAEDPHTQEALVIKALDGFLASFREHYFTLMLAKLGIYDLKHKELVEELLGIMEANSADFTLTFSHLTKAAQGDEKPFLSLFSAPLTITSWLIRWRAALAKNAQTLMAEYNPQLIPRNHLVAKALESYLEAKDITEVKELLKALQQPFTTPPKKYTQPPLAHEKVCTTFCGT